MNWKIWIVSLLFLCFNCPAFAFEQVRFINFSDMHLALKTKNTMKMGADSERIVQTCIQTANATPNLDFVMLIGDLLQDGESFNLDMIRYYLDQLNLLPAFALQLLYL